MSLDTLNFEVLESTQPGDRIRGEVVKVSVGDIKEVFAIRYKFLSEAVSTEDFVKVAESLYLLLIKHTQERVYSFFEFDTNVPLNASFFRAIGTIASTTIGKRKLVIHTFLYGEISGRVASTLAMTANRIFAFHTSHSPNESQLSNEFKRVYKLHNRE